MQMSGVALWHSACRAASSCPLLRPGPDHCSVLSHSYMLFLLPELRVPRWSEEARVWLGLPGVSLKTQPLAANHQPSGTQVRDRC